jgi:O-methyltransferase
VQFLKGWFKDTLPTAPIEKLAVARLDGDMYESTMQAIEALYPKLQPGGYLIVDDYGAVPACECAISDYRERFGITESIETIDWTAPCGASNELTQLIRGSLPGRLPDALLWHHCILTVQ